MKVTCGIGVSKRRQQVSLHLLLLLWQSAEGSKHYQGLYQQPRGEGDPGPRRPLLRPFWIFESQPLGLREDFIGNQIRERRLVEADVIFPDSSERGSLLGREKTRLRASDEVGVFAQARHGFQRSLVKEDHELRPDRAQLMGRLDQQNNRFFINHKSEQEAFIEKPSSTRRNPKSFGHRKLVLGSRRSQKGEKPSNKSKHQENHSHAYMHTLMDHSEHPMDPSISIKANANSQVVTGTYGAFSPTVDHGHVQEFIGHHDPESPNFNHLLSLMRRINPDKPSTGGDVVADGKHLSSDSQFLDNIMRLISEHVDNRLQETLDPNTKAAIQLLGRMAESITKQLKAAGKVSKKDLKHLEVLFNSVAAADKSEVQYPPFVAGLVKAPFCPIGVDCFHDVDPRLTALDVKRLAKAQANYIADRKALDEGVGDAGKVNFDLDAVLTQITLLIASLHRAILKNSQHMELVVANLAGSSDGDDLQTIADKTLEAYLEGVQCNLQVRGVTDEALDRLEKEITCDRSSSWQNDSTCISPIIDPEVECTSHMSGTADKRNPYGGLAFVKVAGKQFGFKIPRTGIWEFDVSASVKPDPHHGDRKINGAQIMGSVDKISGTSESLELQPLAEIRGFAEFPPPLATPKTLAATLSRKKVKVEVMESGAFAQGDFLLLRMARAGEDLTVTFSANRIGDVPADQLHLDDKTNALEDSSRGEEEQPNPVGTANAPASEEGASRTVPEFTSDTGDNVDSHGTAIEQAGEKESHNIAYNSFIKDDDTERNEDGHMGEREQLDGTVVEGDAFKIGASTMDKVEGDLAIFHAGEDDDMKRFESGLNFEGAENDDYDEDIVEEKIPNSFK